MPVCWCGRRRRTPGDQRRRRARARPGPASARPVAAAATAPGSARRWPWPRVPSRSPIGALEPAPSRRAASGALAAPRRRGRRAAALLGRQRLVRLPARAAVGRGTCCASWIAQPRLAAFGGRQPGPLGHALLIRGRSSGGSVRKRSASCDPLLLAQRVDRRPSRSSGASASRWAGVRLCQRTPSSARRRPKRAGGAAGAWGGGAWRVARRRARRAADRASAAERAGQRRGDRDVGSRCIAGSTHSLRRRLQELDEAGVAVGVGRQVVGQQRGVDLGGDRDLRRASASPGSAPGRRPARPAAAPRRSAATSATG